MDYQTTRLRRIVAQAYRNVPFFKEIYDRAGISPDDVRNVSDLKHLPLVSRKDLQRLPQENILSRQVHPGRLIVRRTTGSTGEPLTIRRSASEELMASLFRLRLMRSYGLRRRDRMVRIGTRVENDMPFVWRILQRLGQYRQSQIHLLEPPAAIADRLLRMRPDILSGNSSVLARLSQEFRALPKDTLKLRFIVGGSEALTPMMKREISRVFAVPMYDTYGSEELDIMAWECQETGLYHVCDDHLILEVLKNGVPVAPGERGEAVATSLHFSSMPFIRYRVGDEVTVGEPVCPCGLPFSTLQAIDGRKTDYLILPGGREIFASSIAYILHAKAPWIKQYELVQEKTDRVTLRVVADGFPPRLPLDPLVAEIRAVLGQDVAFLFEHINALPPGPGGKYRVLRSLVRSPYA